MTIVNSNILPFFLLAIIVLPLNSVAQDRPESLSFVYTRPHTASCARFTSKVYTEALKRMSIGFEFVNVPPRRASADVAFGKVDGELNRVKGYWDRYPDMVKVPEPNFTAEMAVYTLDPDLKIQSFAELKKVASNNLKIGYVDGIPACELALEVLGDQPVTTSPTRMKGMLMLASGRIDLFVVSNRKMADRLLASEKLSKAIQEVGGNTEIYLAGKLGEATTYSWLHKRYEHLIPELVKHLRDMKQEGLFRQYSQETGQIIE